MYVGLIWARRMRHCQRLCPRGWRRPEQECLRRHVAGTGSAAADGGNRQPCPRQGCLGQSPGQVLNCSALRAEERLPTPGTNPHLLAIKQSFCMLVFVDITTQLSRNGLELVSGAIFECVLHQFSNLTRLIGANFGQKPTQKSQKLKR